MSVLELCINGLFTAPLLFCVWILLLSIMFLRTTHVACISSFFEGEGLTSILWYKFILICLFYWWTFGSFTAFNCLKIAYKLSCTVLWIFASISFGSSFLQIVTSYTTLWIFHSLFNQSPMNRQWACLQSFAVNNNVSIYTFDFKLFLRVCGNL